jgi:hypothetical protein
MKFELTRTTATFGVYNPREEKNKGPACDIPFEVTVGADLLSMLVPAQEELPEEGAENVVTLPTEDRLVAELYSEEGYVRRPAISPLHINRKPEGVTVKIWDQEAPDADPLVLQPCRFTTLQAELQSPHQIVLTGKIQHSKYSDSELVRISHLMNSTHDISWEIEQGDMFEENDGAASAGEGEAQQEAEDPEE